MSDDRAISVLLVGYGLGGRVFHGPLVSTTPGLSLDAVVTSNPDRQAQARAAYPNATIYSSVEDAWAGGYELAAISTANVTHVPYATAALRAGLHVVLDKPLAPTAADAEELSQVAAQQDRLIIPFQNRRWDSDFLTSLAAARSGDLGTVHRFDSRIERMRVVLKGGWRESTDPRAMGGALYDLGAHAVDQALLLMGPVESVVATARSVRAPGETDDDATVLLTHTSGAISMLVVSLIGAFADPRFVLYGTRGGLRVDVSDSQEAALVAGHSPQPGVEWGREPAGTEALLLEYDDANAVTRTAVPLQPGNWPYFYAAVERAVRGEGAPPVLVADVIANLRVLDAARASALSGERVSLDPPAGHRA